MWVPPFSLGLPEIGDEVYERMRQLWGEECRKEENTYRSMVFGRLPEH